MLDRLILAVRSGACQRARLARCRKRCLAERETGKGVRAAALLGLLVYPAVTHP